jgi:hypothetical protein
LSHSFALEINKELKMICKFTSYAFLLLISTKLCSQSQISGKITDAKGKPLSSAIIRVENSSLGTKSEVDGTYKLIFPIVGSYELTFSILGYTKKSVFIKVDESSNSKVKEVKVKGQKNKSSESSTLAEQKAAVVIKESMGAQEMSRKGASDAQAAVTKMSGISKEEGTSQIFVRGLGDRYNTTTLNGMFLPSDNPEFKNISLEYFPAEIIQSIGVSKTYNNTLLGDFGGASIDIATKEYTGKPYLSLSAKTGLNSQAIAHWNYGSGMSYFGTIDNQEFPTRIEGKFIDRDWQPKVRTMPRINSEIHADGGWSQTLGKETRLSVFGTFTTSNKFQYFSGISKVLYASGGEKEAFVKTSYNYSVNQTGMLNTVLQVNSKFKSKLNLLGFRTAGNQVNEYLGYNNGINDSIYRRRLINDISTMYIVQWINDYQSSERILFSMGASYNRIENIQPNRLTTSLTLGNGSYKFLANNSGDHSSYYQNLLDNDYTLNVGTKIKILADSSTEHGNKLNLNIGYTYRFKDREFNQTDYIFRPKISQYPDIHPSTIDDAFSATNYNTGRFTMEDENPKNGKIDVNVYRGDLTVHSPSIGIDFVPNKKIAINFGARIDLLDQNVNWNIVSTYPNKGNVNYNDMKILPFINAKHIVNETQNVKLAFSKTYTLPQFKELAPFLYFDISTYNTRGNPFLYASDNYNLDIKYEWFPTKTELFSIGGFGKFIQNPINKVFEASAGADQMVFVNSGEQATVFGVEMEFKKRIFDRIEGRDTGFKHALIGGFNISALYSNQDLNKDKIAKENKGYTSAVFTNTNAGIQGASPLVFNIDLTYRMKLKQYEPQLTVVFNYFFDRIYALGAQGAGNVMERGIPSMDFITRHKLSDRISATLNMKNLLNPSIERYQQVPGTGNVTISTFKRGYDLSLGINYNF